MDASHKKSLRSDMELLVMLKNSMNLLEVGLCGIISLLHKYQRITALERNRLQKIIDQNLPERNRNSFVYKPGQKQVRVDFLDILISKYSHVDKK